jgi:hypothetical protein
VTRPVDRLVHALLHEGVLLYPYRPSALKNQHRWALGGLYPAAWSHEGDRTALRCECLVECGPDARITIDLRFLQLHGQEAVVRSVVADLSLAALRAGHEQQFRCEALVGLLSAQSTAVDPDHIRLSLRVANMTAPGPLVDREDAQRHTLLNAQLVLGVVGGAFVSALDPPAGLARHGLVQDGVFPVLVGIPGARDTIVASSIILDDYPKIAPESAGDFHDATEIDEMLALRVLTLTDAEKAEARGDPRARGIVERAEALDGPALRRLHGTWRTDALTPGTRVRLRPRPGGDIFDRALAGRVATIAAVERDLEDRVHYAVTVDDDPGRDLGAAGWPGHRFFYAPEEVEPL